MLKLEWSLNCYDYWFKSIERQSYTKYASNYFNACGKYIHGFNSTHGEFIYNEHVCVYL